MTAGTLDAATPAGSGDFAPAWVAALAELELDAGRAEAVLAAVHAGQAVPEDWHSTWAPPRDLGALPASLAHRARLLLDRQLTASHRLARACADAGQAVARDERMSGVRHDPSVPVFVDTTA